MHEIIAIAFHLTSFYLTLVIIVLGFVVMIGGLRRTGHPSPLGQPWARRVAHLLLVMPIVTLSAGLTRGLAWFLDRLGRGALAGGRAVVKVGIDPLLIILGRLLRTVFFPRR